MVERGQLAGGSAGVLYRACFADGSTINVRYGREAMREELAQSCGGVDAAAFDMYVNWLRRLYVIEMPNFIDRNYDSALGLLASPRALAQLVRLGAFKRLGSTARRRFTDRAQVAEKAGATLDTDVPAT